KMLTDMATRTNSYHAFVFAPQWLADFATPGYLEALTSRVAADKALQWQDIAPFFRNFSAVYAGRNYTVPVDGDFQMVYYRTDLLAQGGLRPPETWDDYLKIAAAFDKKDLNGDGTPDFGSCIAKKRNAQSYWMVWSVAGSFLQSQGTRQGSFFDLDTMKPLVGSEAFAEALRVYVATGKYGPPDELNWDVGDSRSAFVTGRRAAARQGRRVRLPVLHEPARPVQRRRHERDHGVQSLSDLPVQESRPLAQGGHEPCRGPELSRSDRGQPEQPEHGAGPAHPSE